MTQSSETPEKIQPLHVDVSQPTTESATNVTAKPSRIMKVWLPVALLFTLAFVVFALPSLVSQSPLPKTKAEAPTLETKKALAVKEQSPWAQAQLAKHRKGAQDSLQNLLDLQFELEALGVQEWANDQYEAHKKTALTGDQAYQAQEYQQAQRLYNDAFVILEEVQAGLPDTLNRLLETAAQALAAADKGTAVEAYQQLLKIEPDHKQALRGLERAKVIDQVLALVHQAQKASDKKQWANALQFLEQAKTLDPDHPGLEQAQAAIHVTVRKQQYSESMGKAYAALSRQQWTRAKTAFNKALSLIPGDSQALAGLVQVKAERETLSIQALLKRAKQTVIDEQWADADAHYRKVLAIDSSLKGAQQQHALVKRRLQVDQELVAMNSEPLRLSSSQVYQAALVLLERAKKESPQGARLRAQIKTLSQHLTASQQEYSVALESDERTSVILLRVARLGSFKQHSVALKPGEYTLLGSRKGYRDVRLQFTVSSKQVPNTLRIACTEKI